MGNKPSLTINLAKTCRNKPYFRPGDPIQWQVILNNPEAINVGSAKCQLKIWEQLSWTEERTYYYYNAATKSIQPATETIRKNKKKGLYNHINWWNLSNTSIRNDQLSTTRVPFSIAVNPGTHQSPIISNYLPNNLPPSYNYDDHNYIKYVLRATLPVHGWIFTNNIKTQYDLHVKLPKDQRQKYLEQSEKVSQKWLEKLYGQDGFAISIKLQESTLKAGMEYNVKLKIVNPHQVAYSDLEVNLEHSHQDQKRQTTDSQIKQHYTYSQLLKGSMIKHKALTSGQDLHVSHSSTSRERDTYWQQFKDYMTKDTQRRELEYVYFQLKIPPNLSPNLQSNYFRVDYAITVKISFPYSGTRTYQIPIKIVSK